MQAASQREETEWRVQSKIELMPAYRAKRIFGEKRQAVDLK